MSIVGNFYGSESHILYSWSLDDNLRSRKVFTKTVSKVSHVIGNDHNFYPCTKKPSFMLKLYQVENNFDFFFFAYSLPCQKNQKHIS